VATTIKYDNTDVESGGGGESPQPGMYPGKVISVKHRTQKSNGDPCNDLEVVVDVGEEYKRLWTYIGLEKNTAWKMREFTDAVGLPAKGELTAAKIKSLEGKPVSVKVAADTDLDGEYRGKVKNLFKPGADGGKAEKAKDADTPDESYDDWSVEDLVAEIEERELEVPKGRKTAARLVAILVSDDEGETEPDDDDGDDDAAAADEYDDWPVDDLIAEIEERELDLPKGRKTKATLIQILRDADSGGAEPDGDAEPEDEYDEWDLADLKAEVAERNEQGAEIEISGRSSKEKLIAALREDDANAEPF
jgi:hypothetical protein